MANRNLAVVVVVVTCGGSAFADETPFRIYENSSGLSLAGLDVGVNLVDRGTSFDVLFYNRSTAPATITDLYVENTGLSASLSNPTVTSTVGTVAFSVPANPLSPASFPVSLGGAWGGNLWSAEADSPEPTFGINPSESLTLNLELGSMTFAQVASAVQDPERFRIVAKIQGLSGGISVWGVTPTPGTAVLIGLGGLLTVGRRRRS